MIASALKGRSHTEIPEISQGEHAVPYHWEASCATHCWVIFWHLGRQKSKSYAKIAVFWCIFSSFECGGDLYIWWDITDVFRLLVNGLWVNERGDRLLGKPLRGYGPFLRKEIQNMRAHMKVPKGNLLWLASRSWKWFLTDDQLKKGVSILQPKGQVFCNSSTLIVLLKKTSGLNNIALTKISFTVFSK